jgi:hypothetical protein
MSNVCEKFSEYLYRNPGGLNPMKRIVKVVMILLMLIGIVFSISNSFSVEIKAGGSGDDGHWEYYTNGTRQCVAPGTGCKTGDDIAPNI